MSLEKPLVSATEIFTTLTRTAWPVVKVKVQDALQHEEIPLGDTIYKLRIADIDLHNTNVEIVNVISTGTRSQNDVMVSKEAITSKNPFLNWTSQDVGRWGSTLGSGKSWDKYETILKSSKITGVNLTTITLNEFENMGIEKEDAKILLRARDKILGFGNNSMTNEEQRMNQTNEFHISNMLQEVPRVAEKREFQVPMQSWQVSTVHDWIIQVARSHESDQNWKKCFDIIYEHMIDGATFKDINANVLIQYGMKESYAIALIQTRDAFLRHPKIHHSFVRKHEDNQMVSNDKETEHRLDYEVGIFEFAVHLHGPLQLLLKLMSNEGFVPDCHVHVKDVDFFAKMQIEFDIVRNIIKICFLEKPRIKTNIDIKIKFGISIPLLGEDLWLPTLAEKILQTRGRKNPIVIRIDH